jgi:hypothetical protein
MKCIVRKRVRGVFWVIWVPLAASLRFYEIFFGNVFFAKIDNTNTTFHVFKDLALIH